MKIFKYVPDKNEFSNPFIKFCFYCSRAFRRGMKVMKPYGENGFTFHPKCLILHAEAEIKRFTKMITAIKKVIGGK